MNRAKAPPLDLGRPSQTARAPRDTRKINKHRYLHGALSFETIEPKAVVMEARSLTSPRHPQSGHESSSENFMIAANVATTQFLRIEKLPHFKTVAARQRWDRIVAARCERNITSSPVPNGKALKALPRCDAKKDRVGFPDTLRLRHQTDRPRKYIAPFPGEKGPGHSGFAPGDDYTHSTAPEPPLSPTSSREKATSKRPRPQKIPYEPEELMKMGESTARKRKMTRKSGKTS